MCRPTSLPNTSELRKSQKYEKLKKSGDKFHLIPLNSGNFINAPNNGNTFS